MDRITEMTPAWDRRNPDPKKNYGIKSMEIRFVLKGKLGATQFVVATGWFLDGRHEDRFNSYPMGVDIGYHSPVPMYEDQTCIEQSCKCLDGRPCYYDGTSLGAQNFMPTFFSGGSDAVWKLLEDRYVNLFGKLE